MHRFLINKIHVLSCGPHVTHRLPDRSRPQMPISIEEQFTTQILGTLLRVHELNVTVVTTVDDVAAATRNSVCEAKTKDVRKLSAACIGALDFGSLLRMCLPRATSYAPLKRQ